MIESLHIEDLGVIEEADLPLSRGLTALTGETGAGKTMVLTSLGLLLGQRAETTIVRTGSERSLVEGAFLVDPDSRAAARALEAGADLDDDLLLASRTVPSTGRSRAYLGGRSVPASVLSEVGGRLVSVHGQADQLRLRSAAAQRAALDSLGGAEHAALCRRYSQAYQARRQAAQALEEWQASAQARDAEVAQLRTWLEALAELDPRSGEDRDLTAEAERLDHAEDLRRAATGASTALSGEESATGQTPDVVSLIAYAQRSLMAESERDPALAELAARTQRLGIDAADIAAELSEYLSSLSADPARLAHVQDRRGELARACREIGGPQEQIDDVDALLAWSERAAARLAELDGPQDTATVLAERLATAEEELADAGDELSRARRLLAEHLEQAVTAELEGLEMKGARLVVALNRLNEPGPTGVDLIEDEGAGVGRRACGGGRAAREIGRRLARLARHHQVVVVTHLAQVAAWADTHLVVRKETVADPGPQTEAPAGSTPDPTLWEAPEEPREDVRKFESGRTRTQVFVVEGQERERELARMLSGHEDSHAAVRHAAELLQEAVVGQSGP
ncbi:DNA repair protein RecN [Actinomyces sp. Marseille-P3109]|uniref:DNA repair protein RecN n=1 Tax=Actinomyces sp. Marseille-P3109 TaxID=2083009 RepID=UPI000D555BC3|nr:AAA family ATPase [Actinomyces sp. Marseille-P3109]